MKASEKKREIILILGMQGAGKTTLLKELLRKSPIRRRIIVDTLGEHTSGVIASTPLALINAASKPEFTIRVRFKRAQEGFEWACKVANAAKRCLLIVDEIDMYSNAWEAPEAMEWLVRYGRHAAVGMICIARRPPDLWKTLRANANKIYVLRCSEKDDLKYLSNLIGKEAAEKLKTFKDLEYFCWDAKGGLVRGRTSFR